ncbi:NAD(P)H-binding protein [Trinickia diaoshuihuensis]|uniref:NmrA family NAD(P)-binding protein n=1 Tax=Trinickia diaoshuihuensis TaxID=2292265 RepID=UPI000E241E03|nr:NAD(P)H-binding protein [Trinickia diaoshuihuensis]
MFVIFGASGKVGSATVTALRKAGHRVRAVVRNERQAERFRAIGCETASADLTDLASVRAAIDGAHTVQMLCPIPEDDIDPESTMRKMAGVAADALRAAPDTRVVALSDYGAELDEGTGITMLFHYFETQLRPLGGRVTLLRSAEHMQNWARVIPTALQHGVLPSLHHPLSKSFPAVSAHDVGLAATELLLDDRRSDRPRIVSIEGPERINTTDVARLLSEIGNATITAFALPRSEWTATLLRAGLTAKHAQLIADLYDAHNAGRIDIEDAAKRERRFGQTTLSEVISSLVAAHRTVPLA